MRDGYGLWGVEGHRGQQIIARLDHAPVLRRTAANASLREELKGRFRNVVVVDYQPTCELMLCDFAHRLQSRMPQDVTLFALRLHETPTSYAEWFADDNGTL